MKKIVFVVPILAISLLANCNKGGGGGGDTPSTHAVTFDADNGDDAIIVPVKHNKLIPEKDIPSPTKENRFRYFTFNGWYEVIDGEMDVEPFNFDKTKITQDITLRANWQAGDYKKFKISGFGDEEGILQFKTSDGESPLQNIDITAGEDFTFLMKITKPVPANDEEYVLPDIIDVYVGDSEVPLKDGYALKEIIPEEKVEVTIEAEEICGDIRVEASPVRNAYYSVHIDNYGVDHDWEGYDHAIAEDLEIQFTQDDAGHALPTPDDFYVKFDNNPWGPLSSYTETCHYDETSHILTINKNKVEHDVAIKVRSPDPSYSLLENLSWKFIRDSAISGWTLELFHIGEEKTLEINNKKHKVRLIGFDHDQITGEAKGINATMTFEFVNVITNSSGVKEVAWNYVDQWSVADNYDFPNYSLNSFLNKDSNCVFNQLPSELQSVIKKVKKDVTRYKNGEYTSDSYDTKLFPLSTYEMTGGNLPEHVMKEGKQYEYWKTHNSNKDRIKKGVGKSNGSSYWTRTPRTQRLADDHAFAILNDGSYQYNPSVKDTIGVAPAFCI